MLIQSFTIHYCKPRILLNVVQCKQLTSSSLRQISPMFISWYRLRIAWTGGYTGVYTKIIKCCNLCHTPIHVLPTYLCPILRICTDENSIARHSENDALWPLRFQSRGRQFFPCRKSSSSSSSSEKCRTMAYWVDVRDVSVLKFHKHFLTV